MFAKNYTKRQEFHVTFINPQGELDTVDQVMIKVPYEQFELYDLNEDKLITKYDVLRPSIYSREGEIEKIRYNEVYFNIDFKRSDLVKFIKVRALKPALFEYKSNFEKNNRIELGSKSLEHVGMTEDGAIKFIYKDKEMDISQEFFWSLKYYKAF